MLFTELFTGDFLLGNQSAVEKDRIKGSEAGAQLGFDSMAFLLRSWVRMELGLGWELRKKAMLGVGKTTIWFAVVLPWCLLWQTPVLGWQREQEDAATTRFLQKTLKKHELVGLVACVIKDGRVVTLGVAGVRKYGELKPMTVD
ncbi:MAG: hypothetical protein VX438_00910, partial [Planctomycetota bacterium]|nr:hypothetical protein [Planctomycetota bacterium]